MAVHWVNQRLCRVLNLILYVLYALEGKTEGVEGEEKEKERGISVKKETKINMEREVYTVMSSFSLFFFVLRVISKASFEPTSEAGHVLPW